MTALVTINNKQLQVIEYRGVRVASFAQIDQVHERPDGTAKRNFNENRSRFIEEEDFFELDQPDEIRSLGFSRPQGGTPPRIILMTQEGYSMLVKSFTDDLAWSVQRELVNHYFGRHREPRPLTQGEIVLAQAQAFVDLERRHAAIEQSMARVESRVDDLAESRVWDHCPQNCEPISKIRARMNERFGLPKEIVDLVVWRLPLSPKPAGMVRNQREEAQGSQYAVYAVADITRVFDRFVSECVRETAVFWSHRDVPKRFQLLPGGKVPKPLRAHLSQEASS